MNIFQKLFFICSILPISEIHGQQKETIFNDTVKGRKDKLIYFNDNSAYNYLPVTIITGKEEGPVFSIIAGIHGYEYPPITAVQQLIKEIDPNKLKGTLIIVPIANVASFYTRTPFVNPVDGKNLNTVFPGSETGTLSEQIASWITREVISRSTIFLDIHAGDANEDLIPFVCYYDNKENWQNTRLAAKLAESSNIQYQVSYPYTIAKSEPAKYAFKQAVQDGKTALSIESGKLGNVTTQNVEIIKRAVYNMLEHMKMYCLRCDMMYAGMPSFFIRNQVYIKVEKKGIFVSSINSGDQIKKGEEIGFITDEFGKELQRITAPEDGVVLYKIGTPPVNIGETLFCIGLN